MIIVFIFYDYFVIDDEDSLLLFWQEMVRFDNIFLLLVFILNTQLTNVLLLSYIYPEP